ncbi:20407_t:CDS:2 [Funneliformis geosporum]|uniref:Methylthioribose-1-phosphate isomerase n=1 Tax=Funneliformis geosporum TaxID=1117311 RepID=A0A9W4T3Z1_9GLOM|nr:1000_t:CDS:2 [Funneliformis geosporum]CAI2192611.1 20407_t:CDS:2 [Funneliformis geosporum]
MTSETPISSLSAIVYTRSPPSLKVLNQLLLPHKTIYETVSNIKEGYEQIKEMKVRGAPAIGIVAALTMAIDLLLQNSNKTNPIFKDQESLKRYIKTSLEYLKTSRPTAVNLFRASDILWNITEKETDINMIIEKIVKEAERMLIDDVQDNKNIGNFGAEFILKENQDKKIGVVTHCNTGSLATAGYGTALGIIRSLYFQNRLSNAYFTETRPYNQGARLTAYELIHDKIPSTLICDSMVSALLSLSENNIKAVIVGADRVASNGDTANKIGTYQLAITAEYHNIMFIVAAPSTSIDLNIKSGKEIIIEERAEDEVTYVTGIVKNYNDGELKSTKVRLPPEGVKVWNPSFDVTPAKLITAIITEKGVITKKDGTNEFNLFDFLK